MAIDSQKIANITQDAYSQLKSKALGGVSKESAQNAIKEAVNKAINLGEEAVGKVQQEMQMLRGKTAREIAEITSQRDTAIFNARQESAQAILNAQKEAAEAIKKARAPKSSEKVLKNGHKEVRKVNSNGAVMVKEYNKENQLLSASVTTLDGSVRKTKYNPVTGKPVKTFTDTTGEDILIEYSEKSPTKINKVNTKKGKIQKPELVSQSRPQYKQGQWSDEVGITFERFYSDGTKEVVSKYSNRNNVLQRTVVEKHDKDGRLVADKVHIVENNTIREHSYINGKRISKEQYDCNGARYIKSEESVYDFSLGKNVIVKAEVKIKHLNPNSVEADKKTVYKAVMDEFGMPTGKYIAKTTYPKGSGKPAEVIEVLPKDLPVIY